MPTPTTVNFQAKATGDLIRIRKSPGLAGEKTGLHVRINETITVTEIMTINGQDWYHHSRGWSAGWYFKKIEEPSAAKTTEVNNTPSELTSEQKDFFNNGQPFEIKTYNTLYGSNIPEAAYKEAFKGLYGLPFQPNDLADPRPKSAYGEPLLYYGRRFSETILSDDCILIISPGKPRFLPGVSKEQKASVLKQLADQDISFIDAILQGETARYYSFEYDLNYYKYVNSLCRLSASYLNLKKYINKDWTNEKNEALKNITGGKENVAFYVEASSGISESSSNSTDKSMLDNAMNKGSEMAKEAEFLLGGGNGVGLKMDQASMKNYDELITDIMGDINKSKNPNSLFSRLSTGASTITSGGNLLFPEIWKNSSYNKSYNIDMKFSSPYGDTESIYRYVLVPFFHVLALSLPRQLHPNGYLSPFLIRAYAKG